MENKFVGAGIVAAIATVLKFLANLLIRLITAPLVNAFAKAGLGFGLLNLLLTLVGLVISVAVVFGAFFLFCKVIAKKDMDMMKTLIFSVAVALACWLLGRLLGSFIPFAHLGVVLLFLATFAGAIFVLES